MPQVKKRVVLHFPGFEPLNAEAHRSRYERAAKQSAATWSHGIQTGTLEGEAAAPFFSVEASGPDWQTLSRIHILDHNDLIADLRAKPLARRIIDGYVSAARVIFYGGLPKYLRHAWRFGLFFLFPFLLVAAGMALAAAIAALPLLLDISAWLLVLTAPLAAVFFIKLFLPAAERLHTLHLFADWELAISLTKLDAEAVNLRLDVCVDAARKAFDEDADEYLITSHSMGSSIAVHVIASLLEKEPDLFLGKRVIFASLGSGILQCALLRPGGRLRQRIGLLARCSNLFWIDVQCLTDSIHFYKSKVVAAAGHPDAPQAAIVRIRFKHMLTAEHYRKIKRHFLRVHRQYVLGADRRAAFDFTLMTAGPLSAQAFAEFSPERLPPLERYGSIGAAPNPGEH